MCVGEGLATVRAGGVGREALDGRREVVEDAVEAA
jgi:hypothetical protein